MVKTIFLLLVVAGLGACDRGLEASPPCAGATAFFPDVGQGQATAIRSGASCALVDAGPVSDMAVPFWGRTIPCDSFAAVLITHWDLDHRGGLDSLFALRPVGELLYGRLPEEDSVLARLQGYCRRTRRGCRQVRGGERLEVLEGVNWQILSTGPDSLPDGNETSVVSRFSDVRGSLLIAGDLDSLGEQKLFMTVSVYMKSDLLLLSHHGSAGSNSLAWLGAVRPRLAVAQAGRNNRYGHPSAATLERLAAMGIPYWSTANLGGVRMRLDGSEREGM